MKQNPVPHQVLLQQQHHECPEHSLAPPLPNLESSAARQVAHIELLVGTSEELLVQVEDVEEGQSQREINWWLMVFGAMGVRHLMMVAAKVIW